VAARRRGCSFSLPSGGSHPIQNPPAGMAHMRMLQMEAQSRGKSLKFAAAHFW